VKFKTVLEQGESKNVVGIVVPKEIVEAINGGKRPPVSVTINGYTYRSTIAVMGGKYMVGVAAEHREKAGVKGGDRVEANLELDTAPREVAVPDDLRKALTKAKALKTFEALSYSKRKEHVRQVEDAKTAETRLKRIDKVIGALSAT